MLHVDDNFTDKIHIFENVNTVNKRPLGRPHYKHVSIHIH